MIELMENRNHTVCLAIPFFSFSFSLSHSFTSVLQKMGALSIYERLITGKAPVKPSLNPKQMFISAKDLCCLPTNSDKNTYSSQRREKKGGKSE